MATFVYKTAAMGRSASGARIDAPDRAEAVRALVRRGEVPLTVEAQDGADAGAPGEGADPLAGAARRVGGLLAPAAMGRAETASFVRELATALAAGLPLVQGLRTLARTGRNDRQREMLRSLIEQVEAGKSLSDAMAAWGRPFGELLVSLTHAGEVSGKLPEVLTHAADLLDKDLRLRRSILAATLYPAMLMVLVLGAVIVVMTVIVPNVLKQLAATGASLPWATRVVKAAADFLTGYWYILVPALLLAIVGSMLYRNSPAGRLAIDTRVLRVPLLGRLLRDVAVSRFTRTLGTLTGAGIPIVAALRITRGTLGNRAMERVIDDVVEQVSSGKTIAEPMEQSGYFPPMLVQIVNLGERSGRLDELLRQAAGAFEDRTDQSVKLFTTALPPLLVVLMAGVIGFIVAAILMALLQVQNSAMTG